MFRIIGSFLQSSYSRPYNGHATHAIESVDNRIFGTVLSIEIFATGIAPPLPLPSASH